jgi:hypothetical protein
LPGAAVGIISEYISDGKTGPKECQVERPDTTRSTVRIYIVIVNGTDEQMCGPHAERK